MPKLPPPPRTKGAGKRGNRTDKGERQATRSISVLSADKQLLTVGTSFQLLDDCVCFSHSIPFSVFVSETVLGLWGQSRACRCIMSQSTLSFHLRKTSSPTCMKSTVEQHKASLSEAAPRKSDKLGGAVGLNALTWAFQTIRSQKVVVPFTIDVCLRCGSRPTRTPMQLEPC